MSAMQETKNDAPEQKIGHTYKYHVKCTRVHCPAAQRMVHIHFSQQLMCDVVLCAVDRWSEY